MSLSLRDCLFFGPALPEPFVKFELEQQLTKRKLLPAAAGKPGKELQQRWEVYRRKLRALGPQAGPIRVRHHVLEPLLPLLGYDELVADGEVATREGLESGGLVLRGSQGNLRVWPHAAGTDLDAPARRGRAYRFSPARVAQRVLLAKSERAGLLTDGLELRLLVCDPARPDSQVVFRLDRVGGWRGEHRVPDSFRLLLALASPQGLASLPGLTEAARLNQSQVTKDLRRQARLAIEGFAQEVLDHPANAERLRACGAPHDLARELWRESLVLIYRLLFILKLESSPDPARAFSFASTTLWRNTYSPNTALARYVRLVLDQGAETGRALEDGLRALFRMFARPEGLRSSELKVSALGGQLFGEGAIELLDGLAWGEHAVAKLLDRLLWTPGGTKGERQRVHYGALDVEDLGRVYEALLELEPGIAAAPMCRLRRAKLEVVLPAAQGEAYRATSAATSTGTAADELDDPAEDDAEDDDEAPKRAGKTKVQWIEDIPAGAFYLRVGLGRKASGSYYTPHPFVRFLVQETLGPLVDERSPTENPQPGELLALKLLDPAMGSGHFLVEACRFLGDKLYEACRACDERALECEATAAKETDEAARARILVRATQYRQRVVDLPDPNDELVDYLPSRAPEGEESGLSQTKAEALCRRLVAVHCLYGVDKNPLAVELAKLTLWLESYAEGLPLTFLDHRLICGDSLTGPFFEQLLTYPGSGAPLDGLFAATLRERLTERLHRVLEHSAALDASVGKDVADLEHKRAAKQKLDEDLAPFIELARLWAGGVMLGPKGGCDDAAYERALTALVEGRATDAADDVALARMAEPAHDAVPYDLVFPSAFWLRGESGWQRGGFDVVLGNPPWDAMQPLAKEFYAAYDLRVYEAPTRRERAAVEQRLASDAGVKAAYSTYVGSIEQAKRLAVRSYEHVNRAAGGAPSGAVMDSWQLFAERGIRLLREGGLVGWVVPSAFHANQSATGIRDLYLHRATLRTCFSFENRNKLFDIDSRFKFATVVARRDVQGTRAFPCAFYLHDLEWLFEERDALRYTREFVESTGGAYLSFLELKSGLDADVAQFMYSDSDSLGEILHEGRIRFGEELHMSKCSHLFTPARGIHSTSDVRQFVTHRRLLNDGYLPLHEGKTFHQYDDRWGDPPRYVVALEAIRDKASWWKPAQYYRLAFRDIARSTDERTGIFCMLPPGFVFGNKAPCERTPERRHAASALTLLAVANAFCFDFLLRTKVAATVNLFILESIPVPSEALAGVRSHFLAHAALRLTCNHEGYDALWVEQLGDVWRERGAARSYPVLADPGDRWALRAAIDAVVAQAYGLSREQYAHVLSGFSHSSYPDAPQLCLGAFDELGRIGLEAFCREHDPYADMPLNDALPQPVIDLSATVALPDEPRTKKSSGQLSLGWADAPAQSGRRAGRRGAEDA